MLKSLALVACSALFTLAGCGSSSASTTNDPPGPTVQIMSPMDNQTFKTTDMIQLTGDVVDPVEGTLTSEKQLIWTLAQGAIVDPAGEGASELIPPITKTGTFTLRLVATDSRGKTGEDSITIVVK
jgi:hypothetical protein